MIPQQKETPFTRVNHKPQKYINQSLNASQFKLIKHLDQTQKDPQNQQIQAPDNPIKKNPTIQIIDIKKETIKKQRLEKLSTKTQPIYNNNNNTNTNINISNNNKRDSMNTLSPVKYHQQNQRNSIISAKSSSSILKQNSYRQTTCNSIQKTENTPYKSLKTANFFHSDQKSQRTLGSFRTHCMNNSNKIFSKTHQQQNLLNHPSVSSFQFSQQISCQNFMDFSEKQAIEQKKKVQEIKDQVLNRQRNVRSKTLLENFTKVDRIESSKSIKVETDNLKSMLNLLKKSKITQKKQNPRDKFEEINFTDQIELNISLQPQENKQYKINTRDMILPLTCYMNKPQGNFSIYFSKEYQKNGPTPISNEYVLKSDQRGSIKIYNVRNKADLKFIYFNIVAKSGSKLDLIFQEPNATERANSLDMDKLRKYKEKKYKQKHQIKTFEELQTFKAEVKVIIEKRKKESLRLSRGIEYVTLNQEQQGMYNQIKEQKQEIHKRIERARTEHAHFKKEKLQEQKKANREYWLLKNDIKKDFREMKEFVKLQNKMKFNWIQLLGQIKIIDQLKQKIWQEKYRQFRQKYINFRSQKLLKNIQIEQKKIDIPLDQKILFYGSRSYEMVANQIKKKTKKRAQSIFIQVLQSAIYSLQLKQKGYQFYTRTTRVQEIYRGILEDRKQTLQRLWKTIVRELMIIDKRRPNVIGTFKLNQELHNNNIKDSINFNYLHQINFFPLVGSISPEQKQNILDNFYKHVQSLNEKYKIELNQTGQITPKDKNGKKKKKKINKSPKKVQNSRKSQYSSILLLNKKSKSSKSSNQSNMKVGIPKNTNTNTQANNQNNQMEYSIDAAPELNSIPECDSSLQKFITSEQKTKTLKRDTLQVQDTVNTTTQISNSNTPLSRRSSTSGHTKISKITEKSKKTSIMSTSKASQDKKFLNIKEKHITPFYNNNEDEQSISEKSPIVEQDKSLQILDAFANYFSQKFMTNKGLQRPSIVQIILAQKEYLKNIILEKIKEIQRFQKMQEMELRLLEEQEESEDDLYEGSMDKISEQSSYLENQSPQIISKKK